MALIQIHQQQDKDLNAIAEVCPFDAIIVESDKLAITEACKMCKVCIKQYPEIFYLEEDTPKTVSTADWEGIAVLAEHHEGELHPVTLVLVGKARELGTPLDYKISVLLIGYEVASLAEELLSYGVDRVVLYDHKGLKDMLIEPYTNIIEEFIGDYHPSTVLVGGTSIGRSLAPRAAARVHAGLTADCTVLTMQPNGDLDQIRPAFGGNIMAHIRTPNHRPQFATVRCKIFDTPEKTETITGTIIRKTPTEKQLKTRISIKSIHIKKKLTSIEDAEILIVAGRAIRTPADMALLEDLADALGGMVAGTRPLIESGLLDPRRQIGLSGRTVKPKVLITCGVSGSVQFVAGMKGSELIYAINTDIEAPIFQVAHYRLVGDLFEIIPQCIAQLKREV